MSTEVSVRVLLLDPDPGAYAHLAELLVSERDIQLLRPAAREDLQQQILSLKPDAIFVDTGSLSALYEVMGAAPTYSPIFVLTAATTEYAVQAFELGVADYLLKPIEGPRLQFTLRRLRVEVERRKRVNTSFDVERLVEYVEKHLEPFQHASIARRVPMRFGRRHRFIDVLDICCVVASGAYVTIRTAAGDLLNASDSISAMERKLPPDLFIRVNRSAIVNSVFIQEVMTSNRSMKVFLKDKTMFQIGTTYRNRFSRFLKSDITGVTTDNKIKPTFEQFEAFVSRSKPVSFGKS